MRLPIVAAVSLAALALFGAAGCGDDDEGGNALEADDFYFEPTTLKAQAGKQITFEIENEGKATHSFTIADLKVDQEIAAGKKANVTFTPDKAGKFEFVCRFHPDKMKGTLEVS